MEKGQGSESEQTQTRAEPAIDAIDGSFEQSRLAEKKRSAAWRRRGRRADLCLRPSGLQPVLSPKPYDWPLLC